MTELDLMLRFLLQAILVLAACRIGGWIGKRYLRQTQVVMEMVVGVALGPSLFGLVAPGLQKWIFPTAVGAAKHPSMVVLYVVAQLGLVLSMFLVGAEFDVDLFRRQAKGALGISLAGIVTPFALGAGIVALAMNSNGTFFREGLPIGPRVLYLGAAMSITAFPMLARIIYERGLTRTTMGTLALGAGASDDAAAWSLLAVVLAFSKGTGSYAFFAIGGGVLFAGLALTVGRALLAEIGRRVEREGTLSNDAFVWTLLLVLLGAYITDAIGVYAVFGAFLIGAAMPKGRFVALMREKLEFVTVGLLLPFFFVYSGLNTQLGLMRDANLVGVALLVLVAATVGKGLACAVAARTSGETWWNAAAIGTLMNSRGLMELIILNIGLQQGIITPTLYTIMALMAIVTTLATSPVFDWIMQKGRSRENVTPAVTA